MTNRSGSSGTRPPQKTVRARAASSSARPASPSRHAPAVQRSARQTKSGTRSAMFGRGTKSASRGSNSWRTRFQSSERIQCSDSTVHIAQARAQRATELQRQSQGELGMAQSQPIEPGGGQRQHFRGFERTYIRRAWFGVEKGKLTED